MSAALPIPSNIDNIITVSAAATISTTPTTPTTTATTATTTATTASTPEKVVIRQQQKPQVPPKPQIDIVRYSIANAKDDMDLDTILSELLELENQLCSETNDQFLLKKTVFNNNENLNSASALTNNNNCLINKNNFNNMQQQQGFNHNIQNVSQLIDEDGRRNYSNLSNFGSMLDYNLQSTLISTTAQHLTDSCASPDVDSAFGDSSSTECSSGSSAASTANHSNNFRSSKISTSDSYRGLMNTPSPTHQLIQNVSFSTSKSESKNNVNVNYDSNVNSTTSCMLPTSTTMYSSHQSDSLSQHAFTSAAEIKAQKIREALEKMREAKMKKIYVKIFLEDGSTKGLLIDERWTVAETMRQFANKLGIILTSDHAIVEEYPELLIKRIYEDHEFTVENIEDWLADSKNKLCFVRLSEKYNFIQTPEKYLLTNKSAITFDSPYFSLPSPSTTTTKSLEWSAESRQSLLKTFIDSQNSLNNDENDISNCNASPKIELDGWLLLKVDGKKSWKKHYFVLRSSGLYYNPKCGKQKNNAKNLHCLMNVYNNQIYACTSWKKKYKAPTEYGFAIKHPRIQVKTSKYIKYVCAEDEQTFLKWITALRITRNSFKVLYKNYLNSQEYHSKCQNISCSTSNLSVPIRVEVPKISMQRLSSLETNSNVSSPTKIINNVKPMLNNNKSNDYRYSTTTITTNSSNLETDLSINHYSPLSQQFKNNSNEFYQQNFLPKYNNETSINSLQLNNNQTILRGSPLSKAAAVASIKRHSNNNQINNNVINNCYEYQKPQQIWNENSSENIVFDQDECGTIKRQPPNNYNNELKHMEGLPYNNLDLIINETPKNQFKQQNSPIQKTKNLYESDQCLVEQQEDCDSDEEDDEQLPPPPPQAQIAKFHQLNVNIQKINNNNEIKIINTPKKQPPPPPPKRSDIACVLESNNNYDNNSNIKKNNEISSQKMNDLFAELQRATERQKFRIGEK